MKKALFLGVIFAICLTLFSHNASAFQLHEGKVMGIEPSRLVRHIIHVQGADGKEVAFLVGMRTKYIPKRMPLIGERVRVKYLYKKGWHIGYVVTILPPGAPVPQPSQVLKPDIMLSGQLSVIKEQANFRSGPGAQYQIIAGVVKGQVLILKGQTKSWYYVVLPDRQVAGWVHSGLVKIDKMEVPPQTPGEPLSPESEKPQSF